MMRILPTVPTGVLAEYRFADNTATFATFERRVIGRGELVGWSDVRITRLDGSVVETFLGRLVTVRPL